MANAFNLNGVYTFLGSLEQAALKSTDAHVQAFGASMSNALVAFKDAVPGLAATFVNIGIAEAAKAEPIFGLLIPAEAVIDPAVSGFASLFEGMLLGSGTTATPAAGSPPSPQAVAE